MAMQQSNEVIGQLQDSVFRKGTRRWQLLSFFSMQLMLSNLKIGKIEALKSNYTLSVYYQNENSFTE